MKRFFAAILVFSLSICMLSADPWPTSATIGIGSHAPYSIYFNGTLVVEMLREGTGESTTHKHPVPLELLAEGKNVLCIKTANKKGAVGDYQLVSYVFILNLDSDKRKVVHVDGAGKIMTLYTDGSREPAPDQQGRKWNELSFVPLGKAGWAEPKFKHATGGLGVHSVMLGRTRVPFVMVAEKGKLKTKTDSYYYRHTFDLREVPANLPEYSSSRRRQKTPTRSHSNQLIQQAASMKTREDVTAYVRKLKAATGGDPENLKLYEFLGYYYLYLGDKKSAREAYVRYLKHDPGNKEIEKLLNGDSLRVE